MEIENHAFSHCSGLTDVRIPEGVRTIRYGTFWGCDQLASIELPDGLECISWYAFCECKNLESIDIPDHVSYIGDYAFSGCERLKNIEIPIGATDVGEGVFSYCNELKNINVADDNMSFVSHDGILYNKDMTELLCAPGGLEGDIHISDQVITIKDSAFEGCGNLANISLPNGVTNIEDDAFEDCSNLESVNIPSTVMAIGRYAFEGCNNVTLKVVPGSYAERFAIENNIKYVSDGICIHNYTSKITKPSTCVAAGEKTFTCEFCGDTYTETIPAAGHTYNTVTEKATINRNGSIAKKCTVCGDVESRIIIDYPKTINLSKTSDTYNGKNQKPSVTVRDSQGKVLTEGTDYSVSYSGNCKDVGKYTVTINFTGNYSGSVEKTFTITPKSTSFVKVKAAKKGFTAKWKKQISQTTGYQIQYSTSKKFAKKATKAVNISKNKTTSKSISKLKAKKKYYVRVRTYKTVKIDGKNTKIYSDWSKVKSVAAKK